MSDCGGFSNLLRNYQTVDFLTILPVYLASLAAAIIFMSGMFMIGKRMQRYDIVDVAWGLVFIVITATSLLMSGVIHPAKILVLGLVAVWGLRLSNHIYRRLRSTTSEDKRYVEMRKKWQSGNQDVAIFFRIYMIQALLASIICLPVIILNTATMDSALPFVIVGLIVWVVGFSIEALADRQLRNFIRNPQNKGKLMTRGIWRYSRHPNYFGEVVLWWGVGIIALGVPFGWVGLIGPALISYLIIFVSGVPLTEKAFAGRIGWGEYKRKTSIFVPWFTKAKS